MARSRAPDSRTSAGQRRWSLAVTVLLGIGIMAAVDEIVFHQILAWHHFYDRSTPTIGLLSDGLLHSAELFALVAGFLGFAELRRRHALVAGPAWAGLFLGLGGFQLFDGVVDHKVLRLHQVRYGVDLLPYDLAWNTAGAVLLAIGLVLARRSRRHRFSASTSTGSPAGPQRSDSTGRNAGYDPGEAS